jgi:hypothetical protein
MKFLFDDESFSFETLRTTGFAAYGGADLGEVLATAHHIGEGDEAAWHQAWKATAQRVAKIGEQALASGHRVSAREALLRASRPLPQGPAATGREGAHRRLHHPGHVDRRRGGR